MVGAVTREFERVWPCIRGVGAGTLGIMGAIFAGRGADGNGSGDTGAG